jgi:molybdate transport system ATP-binding protein
MITLSVEQAILQLPEIRSDAPVCWTLRQGEQYALVGANGSGKTILADLLQGRYLLKEGLVRLQTGGKISDAVKCITFRDIHTLADHRNTYYQQRWHATETDELPTVGQLLSEGGGGGLLSTPAAEALEALFNLRASFSKKIVHLSSGELRKFLIIRTLLSRPGILLLDNPFIGLDAASRPVLVDMLEQAVRLNGLQIILILSDPADIPAMVTHVVPLLHRQCLPPQTRTAFLADKSLQNRLFPLPSTPVTLPAPQRTAATHQVTFRMEHVTIRYASRTILKDVCWEVKNGEKWALCGPNGSGKSLLLSLVYADNPQSYAQTLYLFDRRRGTGESIWEIKERIGYVSPEMHLYYQENVPALDVACSGFFDSVGLFRQCSARQRHMALEWMEAFGIGPLGNRPFLTLSSGEQRLTLLARAFVKDPDLIILDEPLHGLDVANKQRTLQIIESFSARQGKTLIYVTHCLSELPPCIDRQFQLTIDN